MGLLTFVDRARAGGVAGQQFEEQQSEELQSLLPHTPMPSKQKNI